MPHIFVSIYFRNLPNTLKLQSGGPLVRELEVEYVLSWPDPFDCRKCTILRPNYCLFIAGICMPISCPEIGGVICIIMAGPFIPYPSTCLER